MENSFSPAYALQTQHPYAQWAGKATYPGQSVLAVRGFWSDNRTSLAVGSILGLIVGAFAGTMYKSKVAVPAGAALGVVAGAGAALGIKRLF